MKGLPDKPREISTPAPLIDLMAALKRSLVQEPPSAKSAKAKLARSAPDRRQKGVASACVGWPKEERRAGDRTGDGRQTMPDCRDPIEA
jgi:hypothetical protein